MPPEEAGQGSYGEAKFSQLMQELDRIVKEFEAGTVEVDEMPSRFRRAVAIYQELDRRLRKVRLQIEQISADLEPSAARGAGEPGGPVGERTPSPEQRISGMRAEPGPGKGFHEFPEEDDMLDEEIIDKGFEEEWEH